ncbi:MAG TPA: cache domain-containing protein, partial [Candidatus Tectomicrobia bacterium]|nr:cache domain-containing protein [Candidatus Tectomicrobia bacterium]
MPYLAWPRARLAAHLVALAGATMVPVLVFALIVLVSLWQHHRATVQRGLVDTTRAQAFVVQREFESTVLALEDLARSEHLERPDLAAFAVEAEQVRRRHPTWSTVVLVKPSGEQVLNLLRPVGTPLPDLAYADATRRLLATGRPTVSALARSPLTGRHVSGVGITVSGAGGVRYLLFAVIDQASWAALLERWNIEPDWFGIIVDQGGTIVARTRRPEFVGQPATEEYRRRTFQATEGVFRQPTLEGVPVYVSWARVPLGEWSVALAVPAEAVDGPPL